MRRLEARFHYINDTFKIGYMVTEEIHTQSHTVLV